MPQEPNFESKEIRTLRQNGINSKLKHRKVHNSTLSGRFGDPYGRRLLSYQGQLACMIITLDNELFLTVRCKHNHLHWQKLHVAMSLRMQLRRIVIMMIIEYAVPSLALNYPCKEYQIIYSIYYLKCSNLFVYVHAWETNTHARVNLYEMSTCKSCWSLSVSQFLICMSLLRRGFQGNSFWNSKTDSQMYTFAD